jgi:hypothetical protein
VDKIENWAKRLSRLFLPVLFFPSSFSQFFKTTDRLSYNIISKNAQSSISLLTSQQIALAFNRFTNYPLSSWVSRSMEFILSQNIEIYGFCLLPLAKPINDELKLGFLKEV